MDLSNAVNDLVDDFAVGKLAISFSYTPNTSKFISLSFHEPYEWDGEKDPVYISFDAGSKSIYVSNATKSDMEDETLLMFMGIAKPGVTSE